MVNVKKRDDVSESELSSSDKEQSDAEEETLLEGDIEGYTHEQHEDEDSSESVNLDEIADMMMSQDKKTQNQEDAIKMLKIETAHYKNTLII